MSGNARPGRPRGTGYDDSAALERIAAHMAEHPGKSVRAAISASLDGSSAQFDADLRRLQRKIAMKDSGPDARDLLAQPFEHAPPRRTAMWSCHVDVPVAGAPGLYGVTHSVVVGRPVLVVVRDDEPLERAEQPDHPLFKAVETLPVRHDFDHPDYRLICEALGIDPDRGRPPYIEAYETAVERLRDRGLSAREQAQVGAALGLFDGTTFRPAALRRVIELEADPERARRIKEQAAAIMRSGDWGGETAFASLRMSATPWGYEHVSILDLGPAPPGRLPEYSVIDMPLFLAPPHRDDPGERMLCLLYERNLCAVTLSPEEWEDWQAGGDMAHWLRMMDAHTPFLARLKPPECDLSMTAALREAMISTAYDGYAARNSGEPFDPAGPLSYERGRRRIPASGPATAWRTARFAAGLARSVAGDIIEAFRRGRKVKGIPVRVFGGELVVTVYEDGQASFRAGRRTPWIEDRPVDVSVTFRGRSHGLGGIPMIHHRDFRMTYVDDGKCLPRETALPILAGLEALAASLPVPDRGDVAAYFPAWEVADPRDGAAAAKVFMRRGRSEAG